jgi:hypothetical protein
MPKCQSAKACQELNYILSSQPTKLDLIKIITMAISLLSKMITTVILAISCLLGVVSASVCLSTQSPFVFYTNHLL